MSDEELLTETQSRVVPVQYASDETFLQAWDDAALRLALPLPEGLLKAGARVAVWVRVGAHPGRLIVRGAIGPAAGGHPLSLDLREGELERLRKAVGIVRGGLEAPLRDERYQTDDVKVDFLHAGVLAPAAVRNISDGGCFVGTTGPMPPMGAQVLVEVKPRGAFFKLKVKATVTWHDNSENSRGFGVRFDAGQPDKVEKFLFTTLVEG